MIMTRRGAPHGYLYYNGRIIIITSAAIITIILYVRGAFFRTAAYEFLLSHQKLRNKIDFSAKIVFAAFADNNNI